ncbi:50s ribosomal protein l14 protein [Curvularia clavata]|uniref:Large ribosomal subunit protein uL14m n=1 Tax=Curvularia clavata TaxID=95742 RepID=A0A9Q8Z6V1_CURCL|nr:50s ribosomal protein l14 protein [Curvularia clavata]
MRRIQSLINCIDNSGAAIVECVNVLRSKRPAKVGSRLTGAGDRIVVVVKKQRNFGPETGNSVSISAANKVRRGDVRHAVVVRTAKKWQRPDGSVVKFDDNACVLINKAGEPIGSRVSGVVAAELRQKQWSKILSLAPMHV